MASRITRTAVTDENNVQDDVTETPRHRINRSASPISSGWGAPKQTREKTVRAPYLDLREGKLIIKLLEEVPFVNYKRHYLRGRKPTPYVTCPQVRDESYNVIVPCAICEAGDFPKQTYVMNVVEMDDRETVKTWTFGREVAEILQEHAMEPRNSPLDRLDLYFQVWQTQGESRRSTRVVPMKAGDLADYALTPFDEDEIEALAEQSYDKSCIWIDSEKAVAEAAAIVKASKSDD